MLRYVSAVAASAIVLAGADFAWADITAAVARPVLTQSYLSAHAPPDALSSALVVRAEVATASRGARSALVLIAPLPDARSALTVLGGTQPAAPRASGAW